MRFAVLLIVALILRLFFAFALYGNTDQYAYDEVAAILRDGGNVYSNTSRYNYSPAWQHVISVGDMVSRRAGIPFHAALRGFLSVIDVLNALLIAAIVRGRGEGHLAALVYTFNPGVILIVSFHGQFEGWALLPLLGAVYLAARHSGADSQAQ